MVNGLIGTLAIVGSMFVCLAGIGVVRFHDLFARMHAATKATTIGIAIVGIAGAISIDRGAAKIILAVTVILITTPSAAHLIGRAAYHADSVDSRLEGPDDLNDLTQSEPDN